VVSSHVQSVAGSIATAIPGGLQAILPKNCTIGTSMYCVGFDDHVSCNDLPFRISSIIPPEVGKLLAGSFHIEELETAIAKITEPYIRWSLILGLGWKAVAILVFLCYIYWISSLNGTAVKALWTVVHLFGFLSCAPFVVLVVILSVLRSKADQLPPWIQAQQGNVYGLSIGCCCSALIMSVIGFAVWIVL